MLVSNPVVLNYLSPKRQEKSICVLSAEGVCSVSSCFGMTGDDCRLLQHYILPDMARHDDVVSYTHSHMSGGIKTNVTLLCLSWADVTLGLQEIMALSVHSLLHFTLRIISFLALCFTVVHSNISTSDSSLCYCLPPSTTHFQHSLFQSLIF